MSALDSQLAAMRAQLDTRIEAARDKFMQLSLRERKVLIGGGAAAVLIIFYAAIWAPITGAHQRRAAALQSERAIAERLEKAAEQVRAQAGNGNRRAVTAASTGSLLSIVDRASKSGTLGKPAERIQPEGNGDEVRVWLSSVEFNALMRWIKELDQRHGVVVLSIDIERGKLPGSVDARVALVRR